MDSVKLPNPSFSRRRLRDSAASTWRLFGRCAGASTEYESSFNVQQTKFKVWCGNLGVLQGGHASLDWRLNDADEIEHRVFSLLHDLEQDLAQCLEVLSGKRLPFEEQEREEVVEDERDETSGESSDGDGEIPIRCRAIATTIRNLYKISFLIRNQSSRQLALERGQNYVPRDPDTGEDKLLFLAPYDRLHIDDLLKELRRLPATQHDNNDDSREHRRHRRDERDRGANLDDILRDRLTHATTARRRQFAYWEMHYRKLQSNAAIMTQEAEEADSVEQPNEMSEEQETIYSDTQASGRVNVEIARTDFIDETRSTLSIVSTVRDLENQEARLPGPPTLGPDDDSFVCDLCYVLCPATDAQPSRWRKHILEDLRPYVCTYENCNLKGSLYGNRKEWMAHEEFAHRRVWKCRTHSDRRFTNKVDFEDHLRNEDKGLDNQQIDAVLEASAFTVNDDRTQCPVCLINTSDLPKSHPFLRHLANHLERFSLDALPTHFQERVTQRDDELESSDGGSDAESGTLAPDSKTAEQFGSPTIKVPRTETNMPAIDNQKVHRIEPTLAIKTFMLLPNLDIKPDSSLQLGSILTIDRKTKLPDPYKPLNEKFRPAVRDGDVTRTIEGPWKFRKEETGGFQVDLKILGSELGFSSPNSKGKVLEIECERTEKLRFEPSRDYLESALKDPAVKHLTQKWFTGQIYMVTGLMIAQGTVLSSRVYEGKGSDIDGLSLQAGVGVPIGVGSRTSGFNELQTNVKIDPVVLAYSLRQIKLARHSEIKLMNRFETKWALF